MLSYSLLKLRKADLNYRAITKPHRRATKLGDQAVDVVELSLFQFTQIFDAKLCLRCDRPLVRCVGGGCVVASFKHAVDNHGKYVVCENSTINCHAN